MAVQSKEDFIAAHYTHYISVLLSRLKRTSRTARTAATLAFIISFLSSTYGSYRWWQRRREDKSIGRKLVRKNSGLKGQHGERIIYVPRGNTVSKVIIHPTRPTTFDAHRRLFLAPPKVTRLQSGASTPAGPPIAVKPGLNLAFLHQFLSLFTIMVPRVRCKESALLASHAIFLILRTYLSLVVARLDGAIVRDLVSGRGRSFLFGIAKWLSVGTLASYTNSVIKFLQSKISIAFRTRLTRYIHDLYLNDNLTYYKLPNLDGAIGQSADQYLTTDLTLFCNSAASLYSSLGKPLIDLFVFNYQLYLSLGPLASTLLLSNYFLTATLLRRVSPPFGKLKAVEGRKEGDFRSLHARLIANAEEVAFYGGADIEKVFLNKSFRELTKWMEGIYAVKVRYNMIEDFVLKYSWSCFGYIVTALPVFLPAWGGLGGKDELSSSDLTPVSSGDRVRSRTQAFITNKRLMLSLADAGGRMMYSLKDLSELAGYTSRIYTLISTLHRVYSNAYPHRRRNTALYSLNDVQGTLHRGFDGLRFEDVPIVAPHLYPFGGDELIASLTFTIHSGDHLLITGANGTGKSSISRIAAGLWPVYRGLVSRPRTVGEDNIMFLPQRPYLSTSTLRDQIIYPHTELDMRTAGKSDSQLYSILAATKLAYLPTRLGGLDVRKTWQDVLSGGEKQRISLARLLYHEPRYAIIDEGTSAVSSDVEGLLYETCKARNMTLITISTRLSLRKFHKFSLALGEGGDDWRWSRIGSAEEQKGVGTEVRELQERLEGVDGWQRRLVEIEHELDQTLVSRS